MQPRSTFVFCALAICIFVIATVAVAAEPHVVFVVNECEYGSEKTMPRFAQRLRDRYGCRCTVLLGHGKHEIPGLEALDTADVMVLFVRRKTLPKQQMAMIRKYLKAGKPLVALRTANHAFAAHYKVPEGYKTPEGRAEWRGFDAEVLGGNYHGHGPNKLGTDVAIVPQNSDHPILAGLQTDKWHSNGSLYRVSPIDQKATVLLTGSVQKSTEPVAWVRGYKGGRVFYTSLGHPDDFKQPQFLALLSHAVYWTMNKGCPSKVQSPGERIDQ